MMIALIVVSLIAAELPVTAEPAEGSCPGAAQVASVIAEDLASVPAARTRGWRVVYRLVAGTATAPRLLTVNLLDAEGRVRMTRMLRAPLEDCESAAPAVGAIVRRFFENLEWSLGAPLPPVAERAPSNEQAELRVVPSEIPPALMPAKRPAIRAAFLGAGPALSFARDSSPALAVDLRLDTLGGPSTALRLGAGVIVPLLYRSETVGEAGKATARTFSARGNAGFVLQGEGWEIGPALEAMGTFESARADQVAQPELKLRSSFSLGASLGAGLALGARWRIGLELAGYDTLFARHFYVNEGDQRRNVLEAPRWHAVASVGLSYLFFQAGARP
jgi:hypothetical protein